VSGSDAPGTRPSYEELEALIVSQAALIAGLRGEVSELRARLDANSRNSSRPPSSDGYDKPNTDVKKRSLRRSSDRKHGGQDGYEGARLEAVAAPDEQVEHPPERCDRCGGEARQVFDLPEGALLRVVEHVA